MTVDVGSGKNTEKIDVNGDGIIDTRTTTVSKIDVDGDGTPDIVETKITTVDNNNNIIESKTNIDSNNIDTTTSEIVTLTNASKESMKILEEIGALEEKIKCVNVQHLGSMENYAELFKKTQNYMNQVGDKNINLIIDISTLEKFATEAKIYSEMFSEVGLKFNRLSTVNDTELLTKVKEHLTNISLMYDNIEKFHTTITTTSVLQIPDSIKKVSELLTNVTNSIECSLPYLEFFADATTKLNDEQKSNAEMSDKDKAAITSAIKSLDLWLNLVNNEANVTMSGNSYIQEFKEKISDFDKYTDRLKSVVSKVSSTLEKWKNGKY